ncbi:MAG: DUF1456 family protein [Hahellaceae bacterium]|jgi:uncharacterized protein YehS (DUF1456 family)|nr:DUF1456 family protein [Hahellaceae bacterium]MCP5211361.1 DUF1456 family protein [Hahellaceae bacterium]
MIGNDVLRRLRYTLNYDDARMISVFALADHVVTTEQLIGWLKKDEDPELVKMPDRELAIFLNGLIIEKRGKKDGPQPEPENRLTNNSIFMKIKIALNLKAEEVLEILALADFALSKHELSAFFRKPDHKHYRECQDQVLRNFLNGLQTKMRTKPVAAPTVKK